MTSEGEPSPPSPLSAGDPKGPRRFGDLQKTITMAQIAKAAGVSQGAISSLLNDRDYGIRVSEKTRERVFKVCREMGYIPNDLRALVRMYPEFGDFCLLLSDQHGFTEPWVGRITNAALSATGKDSFSLTLGRFNEKIDYCADPETLPTPIRTGVASKFILLGGTSASLCQALLRRGSPLVSLGTNLPFHGVLSLLPDYQMASRLAIEHLFALGHRHLGILSGPFGTNDPSIIELNRGASLAFEQLGLPLDAHSILHGELTFQAGVAAFTTLKARNPVPSALFCLSDAVAAGVISAALAHGLRVPEDLSVIGCGADLGHHGTLPALSTIHLPFEELAQEAVRRVDQLVAAAVIEPAQKELFPVRLIEGGSTANRNG